MWNMISTYWCKKMHDGAMWPIHGRYICPTCMREYPVEWAAPVYSSEYADANLRADSVAMGSRVSLAQ